MGIDWWEHDPSLSSRARRPAGGRRVAGRVGGGGRGERTAAGRDSRAEGGRRAAGPSAAGAGQDALRRARGDRDRGSAVGRSDGRQAVPAAGAGESATSTPSAGPGPPLETALAGQPGPEGAPSCGRSRAGTRGPGLLGALRSRTTRRGSRPSWRTSTGSRCWRAPTTRSSTPRTGTRPSCPCGWPRSTSTTGGSARCWSSAAPEFDALLARLEGHVEVRREDLRRPARGGRRTGGAPETGHGGEPRPGLSPAGAAASSATTGRRYRAAGAVAAEVPARRTGSPRRRSPTVRSRANWPGGRREHRSTTPISSRTPRPTSSARPSRGSPTTYRACASSSPARGRRTPSRRRLLAAAGRERVT